ncbi:MAG: aminotransferase class I/II-fold pyridoxal phosphate-dependent enzyme [Lachnospiraceae bacterium]|nr:aminotransferase class I/II-fold pyridoxal phosphate-dependent enzyme [Lachnospiraceae bacterium]
MSKSERAFHGSDLEKIEDVYGIPKDQIVSFSANVNPLGFSPKAAQALKDNLAVISRYPDRDYTNLKKAVSAYTGADSSHIILGNGVTELLTLFINLIAPQNAVVIGPTYSEYEKDLNRRGSHIYHINAKEEEDFVLKAEDLIRQTPEETDLVILCNPNNPTSGALYKEDLKRLAANYQKRGIWLLIDETYVEFSKDSALITAADLTGTYDNLFVLRGTSKFFATPGLRLGYALTGNKELLDKAAKTQDPWNINSAADLVGTVMFQDTDYIHLVKETVEAEKDYVCSRLVSIPGMKIYPVNGNFVLARLPQDTLTSGELFDILIRQGMMVRNCATFSTLGDRFIRICFMNHEDNQRLIAAMKKALAR